MPTQKETMDGAYQVIFTAGWVDTTRHGFMKDYPASEAPQLLPKRIADAAVASGKAKRWEGAALTSEGEATAQDGDA